MQVDLFNYNNSKENSSPNINYQNHEENNLEFQIKDKLRNSYIPIIHSALKNKLEMINEKDEDNLILITLKSKMILKLIKILMK